MFPEISEEIQEIIFQKFREGYGKHGLRFNEIEKNISENSEEKNNPFDLTRGFVQWYQDKGWIKSRGNVEKGGYFPEEIFDITQWGYEESRKQNSGFSQD